MSKFNRKSASATTKNLAGGKAYKQTDKLEFVSILLTSFVKDQFYRSENETVDRIKELIAGLKDKKFAAKAAIYARTKYGMRSVSHVVAAQVAKESGQKWTKNFFEKIVYRPDDILEIISYYYHESGKVLTHAMRKGFAKVLTTLNDYKLAKYKGEGKEVSMIDAVNLLHPKSTNALTKLIKGNLKSADTWETKLTKAGQQAETEEEKLDLKKQSWANLIETDKLGYFALLRNLRNIVEQAPESLDAALKMLVDEKRIKNSLVLPFRFTTAYTEIEKLAGKNARKVLMALSDALDISCANVPVFEGNTLVALDDSGSMGNSGIDSKSPFGIGSLFASVLVKSNNADFMMFSDDARYYALNPRDSIMSLTALMDKHRTSNGTNFNAIFQRAKDKYDRIVILSDMQGWMSPMDGYFNTGGAPTKTYADYKKRTGADPKIYSFDLQGYGTLQFPQENVYCLTGFSEKVFDTMKLLETDKNALIGEIEAIEL